MIRGFLIFFLFPFTLNAQIITTYAGDGNAGYGGDTGPATSADLLSPISVALDNDENILIGHQDLIRKVDRSIGIITTVAGDTSALSIGNGGPATNALVGSTHGICVDQTGDIYISDYFSNTVRKVTVSTGLIENFAGTGSIGNSGDNGPATAAKFNGLFGICVDTNRGYLYVSCEFNYRVRKINLSSGLITAFAGTGVNGFSGDGSAATDAKLSRTLGIAMDHFGNVYIGDWDNARIRKVDIVTGIISTVAGNGTTGYFGDNIAATAAELSRPTSICFDSCDNLYFSDELNNRVRKIEAITGIITTIAGSDSAGFSGDDSASINAKLNHPEGVCADKNGNIYICDFYNERIRKVRFDSLCGYLSPTLNVDKTNTVSDISIYPNPTSDVLYIDNVATQTNYTLLNMVSAVVQKGELQAGDNSISVQSLPSGVYMLIFASPLYEEGRRQVRKIIKQ